MIKHCEMCDSPNISADYESESYDVEEDNEIYQDEYEYVIYTCQDCGYSWEEIV